MSFLMGKSGVVKGSLLKLVEGKNLIGQDDGNCLILLESNLNKKPLFEITVSNNHVKINNLSKENIFLNGNNFEKDSLKENDEIEINSDFFRYISDEKSIISTEDGTLFFCESDRFIILENKEKFKNISETENKIKDSFYETGNILNSSGSAKSFVENIDNVIVKKFPESSFLFILWDEKESAFVKINKNSSEKFNISRTLFSTVLSEKKAILSQDIFKDSRFRNIESLHGQSINSIMCAPLLSHRAILGIMYVSFSDFLYEFNKNDFDFFCRLAFQASIALENVITKESLNKENNTLRKTINSERPFIGKSAAIEKIFNLIKRVAPTDLNVLIRGETGTGKELAARMIHDNSRRKDNPFICVNCAVLSENLLESELFGHVKGAFTGALENKTGKLEQSEGGTLFLDEVGEIPIKTQVKLLRFLQEKEFEKVGSNKKIKLNVRIISATNCDLEEAIKDNLFREDFYYRLKSFNILMPPLRIRVDDIPMLVDFFIKRFCEENNRIVPTVSKDAMEILQNYGWPGNIRELKNIIEECLVLNMDSVINKNDIFLSDFGLGGKACDKGKNLSFREAVFQFEKTYFSELIKDAGGNITKASKISEIDRTHLHNKLKKYDINPNQYR